MNAKLIFKTVFLLIMLLLLVLMGMSNPNTIKFQLRLLLPNGIVQPAALMYFAFFAAGLLTGTILTAGGGKKSGSGSRAGKSER